MRERQLHALLLPPGPQLVTALSEALAGGPAILPLDPQLPSVRLDDILRTLRPHTIVMPDGLVTSPYSPVALNPEIAVVICTSGSAGVPKGVQLTAEALRQSATTTLQYLDAGPTDRWLCCLPTHHIAGIQVLVRSIVGGTAPVLHERFNVTQIAASATQGETAFVSLVPTMLQRLLDADVDLTGFSHILLGGAAIPYDLLKKAQTKGVHITTTYGMSETCGGCVYDGWPQADVKIRIEAEETNSAGRIVISGPILATGYRLNSSLTKEAFIDKEFRTEDLGIMSSDGRLEVLGRLDDVIITGAEKVIAGQVATVLSTHPAIREVAVFGRPDNQWGNRVVAVIVPTDLTRPPNLKQLRKYSQESLPRAAAPRELIIVSAIPLLPSGKHDRLLLSQLPIGEV